MPFNRLHLIRQVDLFTLRLFLSAVEEQQIGRAAIRENIAASDLDRRQARYGHETMCIGGGLGCRRNRARDMNATAQARGLRGTPSFPERNHDHD